MIKRKIGRFDAYLPDIDLFDLVLKVLSLSLPIAGTRFQSPVHEFHRFFFDMKQKYPDLFSDVYFKDDTEFPYSEEIADCFIRLQESGFVTRPNPSMSVYRIDTDLTPEQPEKSNNIFPAIFEIAQKFNASFKLPDAATY